MVEINVLVEAQVDPGFWKRLRLIAEELLAAEGRAAAEASVVIAGDRWLRELNSRYRGIDRPTDVLSFALEEGVQQAGDGLLGDVYVSLDRAVAQAQECGHSLARELAFLTTRGFLHLLGYAHQTTGDEELMRQKQEAVLARFNLGPAS